MSARNGGGVCSHEWSAHLPKHLSNFSKSPVLGFHSHLYSSMSMSVFWWGLFLLLNPSVLTTPSSSRDAPSNRRWRRLFVVWALCLVAPLPDLEVLVYTRGLHFEMVFPEELPASFPAPGFFIRVAWVISPEELPTSFPPSSSSVCVSGMSVSMGRSPYEFSWKWLRVWTNICEMWQNAVYCERRKQNMSCSCATWQSKCLWNVTKYLWNAAICLWNVIEHLWKCW